MTQTPEGPGNGLRATRRPTFGQAILGTFTIWLLLLLKSIGSVAVRCYDQIVYYLEAYLNVLAIQENYWKYRERLAADPDWHRREEEERCERRRRAAERRSEEKKQQRLAAKYKIVTDMKAAEATTAEAASRQSGSPSSSLFGLFNRLILQGEKKGSFVSADAEKDAAVSGEENEANMEKASPEQATKDAIDHPDEAASKGTEDQAEAFEQSNQPPKLELSSRQLNVKNVAKTQSVHGSDGKEKPVKPLTKNLQWFGDNDTAEDPEEVIKGQEMAEASTINATDKEPLETPDDESPEAVVGQGENKPQDSTSQDLPETGCLTSNVGPTPGPTILESQPYGINSLSNAFQPTESEKKGVKPNNKSDDSNIITFERPRSMIEQATTPHDNMVPKAEPVDTLNFSVNLSDTETNADEVLGSNMDTKVEENGEDKDRSKSKKDVKTEDMVKTNEDTSSSKDSYSDDSSNEEEDSHDKEETDGDGENGNWREDGDMDSDDSKIGPARRVCDSFSQTPEPETGSEANRLRSLGVDNTDVQRVADSEAAGLTRPNSSPSKEVTDFKEKSAAGVIPVTPNNEFKRPDLQPSPSSPVLQSIEGDPLSVHEDSQPQDPNSYNSFLMLKEMDTTGGDADAENNTFMDSGSADDADNQTDPSSQNTSITQAMDLTTKPDTPLMLNTPQNCSIRIFQHSTPPDVFAQTQVPASHQKQFAVKKHVTFAQPKVSLQVDEKSLLMPAEKVQKDGDDGGGGEERVPIDAPGSDKRPAGGLASDNTTAGVNINIDSRAPETQLLAAKASDVPTVELTTTDMRIPGAFNPKSDSEIFDHGVDNELINANGNADADLSAETTDNKDTADSCTQKDAQEHKETSGGQEDGDKPATTTPQLAPDTTSAVLSVTRGDLQEEPTSKNNDAFDDSNISRLYEENNKQDDFETCLPDTNADEDTKASSSSFPNGNNSDGEVNANANDAEHDYAVNDNPDGNLHIPRVRSQSFTTMSEGIGQQKALPIWPMQSQLKLSQKPESPDDEPEASTKSPEVTAYCPENLPQNSEGLSPEKPETSENSEDDKPAESTPLNQPIPENDTAKDIQKPEKQTTVCQDIVHNSEPTTKETTMPAQIQTQTEEANLSPTSRVLVRLGPSQSCTTIPIMNARTPTPHVSVHTTPNTNTIRFRAPLFDSTHNIPSEPAQGWRTHIIRPANAEDLATPDIHIQYGSAIGYVVINKQKQKVRWKSWISKRKIGGDEEESPMPRREGIGKTVPSVEGAVMGKGKDKEGERKRGERKHGKKRRGRAEEKETDNDECWFPKVNKDETWWEKGVKNRQDIPSQAAMKRKEREWKERREERREERRGHSVEKIVHEKKEKEAAEGRRKGREVQRGGTRSAGGHPENIRELAVNDEDLDRLVTGRLPRRPERKRRVGTKR